MLGKIKFVFGVLFRGILGGFWGILGASLAALAVYFCVGLFTGTASVQNYVRNKRELGETDARIADLQKRLDAANLHIKLLQEHSPDFVSEMALRYLNLGDPQLMIIRN